MKSSPFCARRRKDRTLESRVVRVEPFEAGHSKSTSWSARSRHVQVVQIRNQPLDAAVRRRIFERPFDRARFPEFVCAAELAAHEKQLLARMREHVAEEQPQVGEFLPVVAGHFLEQRAFAVHDFVVRERQDEIFVEGVEHGERQLAVVVLAVEWDRA